MTVGSGPHTDDDTVVAEAILAIIEANKIDLQLDDVLYGNHILIPRASAAVVMAMGTDSTLAGVAAPGGRVMNELMVQIDLHWSKVGDEATERRNCDNRATALRHILHSDTTLGGIIIHGFVHQSVRGETPFANNSLFRTVRMSYVGQTKTYLTPSP